jgi:Pyridoxamine 5'-phosphate oxidase
MGKRIPQLNPDLREFIQAQKIFFVGTARSTGTVNISPKGMDSLRVLDDNRVLWLNATGSGNETATHLLENTRMTIMFCAFEGKPLILRLYGQAKVYHQHDEEWAQYLPHFPETPGARQIFDLTIELVQTSCGFAVPFMDYQQDRDILSNWAAKQGKDGIKEYWQEKNTTSLDGHPTGIF